MTVVKLYLFALLLFVPPVLAQTAVQLHDHSGVQPEPTEGVPFDAASYYRAKADFARERMQWEEIEAQRYARYAARLNLGANNGMLSTLATQAMGACSDADKEPSAGFWASIGNRMGRSKECREKQTTARAMMCQYVAVEMQSPQVMQACVAIAENDNKWVEFWKEIPRATLAYFGIREAGQAFSATVGLGRAAIEANRDVTAGALANPIRPEVVSPEVVRPEIVEPTLEVVTVPEPPVNQPVEGGGGG